jgi:GH15 family glucan-1,4-alpha-glucosidase
MPEHELLRIACAVRGEVDVGVVFVPRPDYARKRGRIVSAGELGVRLELGRELVTFRSSIPVAIGASSGDRTIVRGTARLRAGEVAVTSLSFDAEAPAVLPPLGEAALIRAENTHRAWLRWAARTRYDGPCRDDVIRSALALKLLVFPPSGAIVAAPTTSLPETIGGGMNWDYRYCWLRDAALTVRTLYDLGHPEEAFAFCDWLLHATRLTRPELRVVYDVFGQKLPAEGELTQFSGYGSSKPVRVHNAASSQLQLDVYGEVADAVFQIARRGGAIDADTQEILTDIGRFVCRSWRKPDHGIWERRIPPQHYTHSRLMCWVALDRLAELARAGAVRGLDLPALEAERKAIRTSLEVEAYSSDLESYTETLHGNTLDASLLLFGAYGFAPASSPRLRSTRARIRERLGAPRGLLYRHEGSVPDGEGAFVACSFWDVDHLARGGGSFEEALQLFERLLSQANEVGLFAEEIDPRSGDALGNFPQAYSHIGVLAAARSLEARAHAKEREPAQLPFTEEVRV